MIPGIADNRGEALNLAKRSPIVVYEFWRLCGGTYGAAGAFSGDVSCFLVPEAGDEGLGVGGGDVTLPNAVVIAVLSYLLVPEAGDRDLEVGGKGITVCAFSMTFSCCLLPKTGDKGLEAGEDAVAALAFLITFLRKEAGVIV